MGVLVLTPNGRQALEAGVLPASELQILARCAVPTDVRTWSNPGAALAVASLLANDLLAKQASGQILTRRVTGSNELVVVFAGRPDPTRLAPTGASTYEAPYSPFAFLTETRILERNMLLFLDFSLDDYRRFSCAELPGFSSLDGLVTWIAQARATMTHVRRVLTLGVCSGAGPAVVAGHHLGADRVCALSLLRRDIEEVREAWRDSETRLYYSEGNNRDRETAEALRDLPGAELYPVTGKQHLVARTLADLGKLPGLLD